MTPRGKAFWIRKAFLFARAALYWTEKGADMDEQRRICTIGWGDAAGAAPLAKVGTAVGCGREREWLF